MPGRHVAVPAWYSDVARQGSPIRTLAALAARTLRADHDNPEDRARVWPYGSRRTTYRNHAARRDVCYVLFGPRIVGAGGER